MNSRPGGPLASAFLHVEHSASHTTECQGVHDATQQAATNGGRAELVSSVPGAV